MLHEDQELEINIEPHDARSNYYIDEAIVEMGIDDDEMLLALIDTQGSMEPGSELLLRNDQVQAQGPDAMLDNPELLSTPYDPPQDENLDEDGDLEEDGEEIEVEWGWAKRSQ
jgi:hypothetical protein